MNDKLKREVVFACFKVLSQHLHGWTEEIHKETWSEWLVYGTRPPIYEAGAMTTWPQCLVFACSSELAMVNVTGAVWEFHRIDAFCSAGTASVSSYQGQQAIVCCTSHWRYSNSTETSCCRTAIPCLGTSVHTRCSTFNYSRSSHLLCEGNLYVKHSLSFNLVSLLGDGSMLWMVMWHFRKPGNLRGKATFKLDTVNFNTMPLSGLAMKAEGIFVCKITV